MLVSRDRRLLAAIVLAALALRLAVTLAYPAVLGSDRMDYHKLAISLASGHGYLSPWGAPETFRAPGYPYFVAAFYAVLGPNQMGALLGQCVLDIGTLGLLWWWARRRLGERAAWLTAMLWGFSLSAIGMVRTLYSECLATFLLVAALILFDAWWQRFEAASLARESAAQPLSAAGSEPLRRLESGSSWPLIVGAGVVFGLLALVRALLIGLPFMLALAVVWRPAPGAPDRGRGSRRAVLAPMLCLLGVYVLMLVPWVARNTRILGSPAFTTQSSWMLWSYHKPLPGVKYGDLAFDEVQREASKLSAREADRYFVRRTWESFRQNPRPVLAFLPKKFAFYFLPFDWEFWNRRIFNPTYLFSIVCVAYGLRSGWRAHPRLFLTVLLPLLCGLLMSLPFFGSARYRLPSEAPLCLAASWGALQVLEARKKRRAAPAAQAPAAA